jgi:hypothetical protein
VPRLLRVLAVLTVVVAVRTTTLDAQDEATLRRVLEGKRTTLRMDMPATSEGVDVFPGSSRPIDFSKVANRLKKYGTAIKDGESILITKIKVKGENVEIHLGGGGYGTLGDVLGSELTTQGADSGTAQQARIANERNARLAAGSRFNLRFPNGVTPEDLTPAAIVSALSEYATIAGVAAPFVTAASASALSPAAPQAAAALEVRKGLSREEIERIAGTPVSSSANGPVDRSTYKAPSGSGTIEVDYYNGIAVDVRQVGAVAPGTIRKGMELTEVESLAGRPFSTAKNGAVTTNKYRWQGGTLEGDFVNGVLVAYRISSN